MKPVISVITPTFRREDLLARCVQSVLAQEVSVPFEHLVVNDALEPLAPAAWMDDPRVRVLSTQNTERCVARNTAAALSQGQWLYFLDDDDYALPGAFAALLHAAQNAQPPGPVLLYAAYQIHNERTGKGDTLRPQLPPDIFPHLFAGEILPLQGSWVARRAFFAAGGFDPAMQVLEDVDLYRRLALLGTAAFTPHVSAMARVDHHTTTTQWARRREFWHLGMERCQRLPDALPRLLSATEADPYWRGRAAREYVGAAVRLWRGGQRLTALPRLSAALRLARGHVRQKSFLRGLRRKSVP